MRNNNNGGFKFIYLLFTFIIGVLPAVVNAQTGGLSDCDDQNNPFDTPCPLDTWVILLAIAAGIFAVLHLNHKQKQIEKI